MLLIAAMLQVSIVTNSGEVASFFRKSLIRFSNRGSDTILPMFDTNEPTKESLTKDDGADARSSIQKLCSKTRHCTGAMVWTTKFRAVGPNGGSPCRPAWVCQKCGRHDYVRGDY